ncbi:hypothetical protein C8Q77DRAFT_741210 [Trametes polyzona]|nr:hypothetical protein C8Q77DRAFT_741210 [Trametes polyzona]
MSGVDDLCGCLAVCCTCCCVGCNEASGLFCFYKSCNCCSRRRMNDNEFEQTVEELYTPGKDGIGAAHAAHVLELEPLGSSTTVRDRDGPVNAQPAARPSMEARRPRRSADGDAPNPNPNSNANANAEGERVPGEPRSERRDRTREWVHAHSKSEPGVGGLGEGGGSGGRPRERSRSRPRSKSHAEGAMGGAQQQPHIQQQPPVPRAAGGSMRERERERGERPSDAEAYAHAWKRSQDEPREPAEGAGAGVQREESSKRADSWVRERHRDQEEYERRATNSPPRLDIPASLRPGRPSSWGPLQPEPLAAEERGSPK